MKAYAVFITVLVAANNYDDAADRVDQWLGSAAEKKAWEFTEDCPVLEVERKVEA